MFRLLQPVPLAAAEIYNNTVKSGKSKADARLALDAFMTAVSMDPLKFYCPNGPQEKLVNTVALEHGTKIPKILCTYANGVGKTTVALHTIANFVYGPQNGWFDHEIFRHFPFPKKIWYCTRPEALKEKVDEFIKLLKPGTYKPYKDGRSYYSRIEFNNGWVFNAMSFEQNPLEYESANVGIICNDEPAPEAIWKAQKSRRRLGCMMINIMTPLYCPPYVLDEYNESTDRNIPGNYFLQASVYDACIVRGIRGHLPADVVDDMVKDYDDDEREARAFGKFMYFAARIYGPDLLRRDMHFVSPEEYPLRDDYVYFHVEDPKDSRANADIYAALTPEGRYIIFDELPIKKRPDYWKNKTILTIPQAVKEFEFIEAKYERYLKNPLIRILDRHFGKQMRGGTGKNFFDLYLDEGVKFHESYTSNSEQSEVNYGHAKVRKQLQVLPDGKPGLVIWDTCYHTWNGLTHYIRKHETNKSSEDKAVNTGKLVKKYKDFPDIVRYLICHGTKYKYEAQKNNREPIHNEKVDNIFELL